MHTTTYSSLSREPIAPLQTKRTSNHASKASIFTSYAAHLLSIFKLLCFTLTTLNCCYHLNVQFAFTPSFMGFYFHLRSTQCPLANFLSYHLNQAHHAPVPTNVEYCWMLMMRHWSLFPRWPHWYLVKWNLYLLCRLEVAWIRQRLLDQGCFRCIVVGRRIPGLHGVVTFCYCVLLSATEAGKLAPPEKPKLSAANKSSWIKLKIYIK